MISLISHQQFKTVPWKNGLGETIELAINDGGILTDFDWRLSIATVAQDGVFSNFSGYSRNLVLIAGEGITLQHDNDQTDKLTQLLEIAAFDGGCKTMGLLKSGTIKDFNIMAKTDQYQAIVETYTEQQEFILSANQLFFIYCLSGNVLASVVNDACQQEEHYTLPAGDLMRVSPDNSKPIKLEGRQMIIIQLTELSPR